MSGLVSCRWVADAERQQRFLLFIPGCWFLISVLRFLQRPTEPQNSDWNVHKSVGEQQILSFVLSAKYIVRKSAINVSKFLSFFSTLFYSNPSLQPVITKVKTFRTPVHRSDVGAGGPLGSCSETVLCQQVVMTTLSSHNISLCLPSFISPRTGPGPASAVSVCLFVCLQRSVSWLLSSIQLWQNAAAVLFSLNWCLSQVKAVRQPAKTEWNLKSNLATQILIYMFGLG